MEEKLPQNCYSNNQPFTPFGLHALGFLGFLYASVLSGTITVLDNVKDGLSIGILFVLWFYLAIDWLLKYSAWNGIEKINRQIDLADGKIDASEWKRYITTSVLNFTLLFSCVLFLATSFYIYFSSNNEAVKEYTKILLGISLLLGWLWNIYIYNSLHRKQKQTSNDYNILMSLFTVLYKILTFRAHTLDDVKKWWLDIGSFRNVVKVAIENLQKSIECFENNRFFVALFRLLWTLIICAFAVFNFGTKWLLIQLFAFTTILLKPLIGLILVLSWMGITELIGTDVNLFLVGCAYLLLQLIIDSFTLKFFPLRLREEI